jgi:hypothetical protein
MNIIKNYGNYCYSDESPSGMKLDGYAVYAWNANKQDWDYIVTFNNEAQAISYAQMKQKNYEGWMK